MGEDEIDSGDLRTVGMVIVAIGLFGWGTWLTSEVPADIELNAIAVWINAASQRQYRVPRHPATA